LIWIKRDDGGDHFFRPVNAKDGTESWEISLPNNDIAREILKNGMVRRVYFWRQLKIMMLPYCLGYQRN
jgi:hypothetical protein